MQMRAIVIVPTANLVEAKTLAATVFGLSSEHAEDAFTPMGSPSGENPPTHHWLGTEFSPENADKLPALEATYPWATVIPYDLENDPGRPFEVRKSMGLLPIYGDDP